MCSVYLCELLGKCVSDSEIKLCFKIASRLGNSFNVTSLFVSGALSYLSLLKQQHQQYAFNFHMKYLHSAATCTSQGHSLY